MPQLRPFRGLRYAAPAVTDYSAVICPPYDVISTSERARLMARDPHNAVRLELPVSYDEAARLFAAWQGDGTLVRDDPPCVYVYEMEYLLADVTRRARGFLCRMSLAGPTSEIRPHEHTMAGPKEDRFALLKAVRANLSPVVLLWQAPEELAATDLLDGLTEPAPDIEAVDDTGVRHRLWTADPARQPAAARLLLAASAVPLTIADGHHRYETARRFRSEVGGPGSDEVLALLFEAGTGGLAVLPTHRLIEGAGQGVVARASEAFAFERVATPSEALPAGPTEIGLWTRQGGGRLRLGSAGSQPDLVRDLDVSRLADALPVLVGADNDALTAAGRIAYSHDAAEVIAAVESGRVDVCFLMAPTPVDAVLAVAAAGAVMPAKSTFFYPKAATGLVFNPLAP